MHYDDQKEGVVLLSLTVVLLLTTWCGGGQSAPGYAERLEMAVQRAAGGRVGFSLVYFPINSASEPQFVPMEGLDSSNAVPFLIEVLRGDSKWSSTSRFQDKESAYFHIARCHAALSLGAIGDTRALIPLVEALSTADAPDGVEEDLWSDRQQYPLSEYAALGLGYLGDTNAVDPLLLALSTSGSEYEFFAYALALLGDVRAVRPLIQHSSQVSKLNTRVHRCLEDLCHAGFRIQYIPGRHTYQIEDFPELGELEAEKVYLALWQHWDREGAAFAREQFETYYPIWQRLRKDRPDDFVSQQHLLSEMIRAGLPALPYVMDRVERGDDSLLPAIQSFRQNSRGKENRERQRHISLSQESISRSECLEWWQGNRDRYNTFLGADIGHEGGIER